MGVDADIKALIVEVRILAQRVESLERRVERLTTAKNIGVGVLIALASLAGGLGALVNKLLGAE